MGECTDVILTTANPAARFPAFGDSKYKGNGSSTGRVCVSVACDKTGLEKPNYGQLSDCLSASVAHSVFLPTRKES